MIRSLSSLQWWPLIRKANFFSYKFRLHRCAWQTLSCFHGNVLDIGAGGQPFRPYLCGTVRYTAVELNPKVACDVRARVSQLPFAAEQFDGVLCTEVLEHVPEPLLVMHNINRVLKPGGLLYVTVPMTWRLHYEPHDYYRYTKYSLCHMAEQAGFEVVEIIKIGGLFIAILARLEDVVVSQLYRMTFPLKPLLDTRCRVAFVSVLLFPLVILLDLIAAVLDRIFPGAQHDALGWAMLACKRRDVGL